ncbi:hypothetical protein M427DRAFT_208413 [Gonapodya prolifera JEL478]|uniref:BRCT domain-containing protein n=1 Tax=Gonapodya prolifera (strain JEL478) TaxID=1344416 RepID=A0A139ANM3_GONPJ|nr:hypothetical protein M427DRAFT_208413 [Gonapodya prolifera JEL478]|eukprot:KXS18340.1 hypothetical protein M427DRAFT_208413 [Gonapodya prolifera JEL478]
MEYIYMTDDTREQLLETHDKYGDPYTRDMTGTELLQMDVSKELDKWRQTDEAVGFEELGQSGLIYKPPRIKRLIKEINERYFQEQPPLSCLFLNVIAWFDVPGALEVDLVANAEVAAVGTQDLTERERERIKERSEETSLHDAASLLRFYGGQPVEKLYHNVTHVIVDSGEMSQLSRLRKIMASRLPVTFRIVTQDWILDSINRSERAPEEQYFPR